MNVTIEMDEKMYDALKRIAEHLGTTLEVLLYKHAVQLYEIYKALQRENNDHVRPRIEHPVVAKVHLNLLDPISWYVAKRVGISMIKLREVAAKRGVPAILFAEIGRHGIEASKVMEELLNTEYAVTDKSFVATFKTTSLSSALKWYIVNANVIAKEKGVSELLRYSRRLYKALRGYMSSLEPPPNKQKITSIKK